MVFSLRRHLDEAVGSKVNSIAKQFVDIKAVDPLTVEITLVGPNADLPTILALHHFMIVQDGTTDFSKGIGTGAFRSELFEPGVRSIGVRNENYFKAQKAPLDTFEYFAIVDENARVNALLSGDVQFAAAIKPQSDTPRRERARHPARQEYRRQLHQPQRAPRHGAGRQGRVRRGHQADL